MAYHFQGTPRRIAILLIFASALLLPEASFGAQSQATFLVSATVLDVCAVAATPLMFGNYTPSSGSPNDASSTVTVTCTLGLSYTIGLDKGTTSGGAVNARLMTDTNSDTLAYGLYTDTSYSSIWGDGTASTVTQGPETGNGTGQPYTVYGRIPASQYVASGGYTDTVTVTVTY